MTSVPSARSSVRTSTGLVAVFRVIALVEAFSWAGLLVGMFFKWIVGSTDIGVTIFGPIHGAVFVGYVVMALLVARDRRWPLFWTTALALAASIPPFCTVWFERWATRVGHLPARAAATA